MFHGAESSERVVCERCGSSFRQNDQLLRHCRTVHSNEPNLGIWVEIYRCEFCEYSTPRKDNLKTHISRKHVQKKPPSEAVVKCPMCSSETTRTLMLEHYQTAHDINLSSEKFEFKSKEEFFEWKSTTEAAHSSQFSRRSGYKTVDGCQKYVFRCHRDGVYKSRGENIRSLKVNGSNKIGSNCPAAMHVEIRTDGKVLVLFHQTHVGHQGEVGRMRMSKDEKDSVAKKIAAGIPFDVILDSVRASIASTDLERRHLMNVKDLHNISRDYGLQSGVIRHQNDLTSVESWIHEIEKQSSAIRFYKPQGVLLPEYQQLLENDFILVIMNDAQLDILRQYGENVVCLDDTHGLNPYGFLLTTILVLDEFAQGFPCAFMFSSRGDFSAMEIFVKSIHKAVGSSLKPNVFMTDMADVFYNAWLQHMGEPQLRLFCSWHVDKAWRKNLNKVKGKEKQANVYKIIRTLMEELDPIAFTHMMSEAIEIMKKDDDIEPFALYFEEHYASCPTTWAYCHRLHAQVNTNMALERFHGILKHVYMKGNKPRRMDISLHNLMRYVRDRLFDRLINLNKGKLTEKMSAIRDRHKSSFLVNAEGVIETEKGWAVYSSRNTAMYNVTKTDRLDCSCQLRCAPCNICIHTYVCSCPDSATKFNLCKHIHAVCMKSQQANNVAEDSLTNSSGELLIHETPQHAQQEVILKTLASSNIETERECDLTTGRQKLADYVSDVIMKEVHTVEDIQLVKRTFNSLVVTLKSQQSNTSCSFQKEDSTLSQPAEKKRKFETQRKFVVTRKPRKVSTSGKTKPTVEEKENIAVNLLMKVHNATPC